MSEKIPRNTRMKDRLSMAFSTELRIPFLDHRVVEFGLSLNPDLMFKNGWSKSVLRQSFAGYLSDDVRLAPKRTIQAPQGKWLASPIFREYVNDLLDSQTTEMSAYSTYLLANWRLKSTWKQTRPTVLLFGSGSIYTSGLKSSKWHPVSEKFKLSLS